MTALRVTSHQMPPPFRTIEMSDPRFEHDGLRHVTVKSAALRGRADLTMFIPAVAALEPGSATVLGRNDPMATGDGRGPRKSTAAPLVILLHGVYGSHWAWALKGGAHRTAARLIAAGEIPPLVIAMPSDGLAGDGSGYVPHAEADYERWIVDEVPRAAAQAAPAVTADSPVFIAGLSMGGFGALRLMAKYPQRFRGASGHSSMTDFAQMRDFVEEDFERFAPPPGERCVLDLMLKNRAVLPPFRFDCGTEDRLLAANRALHEALRAASVPHDYAEFPGGHEWAYWERHLADTLRFFARVMTQK